MSKRVSKRYEEDEPGLLTLTAYVLFCLTFLVVGGFIVWDALMFFLFGK